MQENSYDHKAIEAKWKELWYKDNIYEAVDFSPKPKKYILAELPYPSGPYLHAGHMMRYTVPDVLSRFLRMKGFNVMFPMGWDAFGLPTEGYAIKANKTPQEVNTELSAGYKRAMQDMGYSVDWNREINTAEPAYYKWTQWLFLKFYENGLAELEEMPVWWCKELGNLADEEVLTDENGNKVSERGGFPVTRKQFKQWVLKIPAYAEKLISGLEKTDFPDYIKIAQKNWIGKSVGAEVDFAIKGSDKKLTVFTTRIDTIYGVSFVVISPEHPLVGELTTSERETAVEKYVAEAKQKSDFERTTMGREKTGVFTGSYVINPFSGAEVPLWIGDFVVMTYATGTVMGVPAHDERDFAFAQKFNLPIKTVVSSENNGTLYTRDGPLVNSDQFNGLKNTDAVPQMISYAEAKGFGRPKVNFKIRDWVFSRQRYWGEPIPIVYKADGTTEEIVNTNDMDAVAKLLPLELPFTKDYQPLPDGASPLSKMDEWVNTTSRDGKPAKRETQTMPTWAGSCWYYIRYIDPKNDAAFANYDKMKYWLPVDKYFGDGGHTTMHLLYSRFWHEFFYDQELVPTPEPYQWRMTGGLLLGPDGQKMSKSRGNVLNPKDIIEQFGADATRVYLCFIGPYDATYPWVDTGIKACNRFIKSIYDLKSKVTEKPSDPQLDISYNKLAKHVTDMFENLKMNTAVSEFMKFVNEAKKTENINVETWKNFTKLLAPLAPFAAEDLWQNANGFTEWKKENSVHLQAWPKYDENLVKEQTVTVAVQVNGKVRATIEVTATDTEETVREKTFADEKVQRFVTDHEVKKFIYIPNKIVSIVM